ncbi:MAG: hypothetical protein R3C49_24505 [Planctomycetaceae bacterium]
MRWLKLHGVEMWHLPGFRRKPPVRQTFANLLAAIDNELPEQVLLEFVPQILCVPSILADAKKKPAVQATATAPSLLDAEVWDGKVLRGTRKGDQRGGGS